MATPEQVVLEAEKGKVTASFKNATQTDVTVENDKTKIWDGTKFSPLPPPIPADGTREFGGPVYKAALWYTGLNADESEVSWIVAWFAPKKSTGSKLKVFVMCGTKTEMDNVSPDDILKELSSENCSNMANATNETSKITVNANIVHGGTEEAPVAKISATFGLVMSS